MGTESTCWTVIRDAARGDVGARAQLAERYEGAVRAYLGARWHGSPYLQDLDAAVRGVSVPFSRPGGARGRAGPGRGGFRPSLYGVVRNVPRQIEARQARARARQASLGSGLEE